MSTRRTSVWVTGTLSTAVLILLLIFAVLAGGCQSTGSHEAYASYKSAEKAALEDGIITPEEAEGLRDKLAELAEAATDKDNIAELVGTALASVLAAVAGTNALRNRDIFTKGKKRTEPTA